MGAAKITWLIVASRCHPVRNFAMFTYTASVLFPSACNVHSHKRNKAHHSASIPKRSTVLSCHLLLLSLPPATNNHNGSQPPWAHAAMQPTPQCGHKRSRPLSYSTEEFSCKSATCPPVQNTKQTTNSAMGATVYRSKFKSIFFWNPAWCTLAPYAQLRHICNRQ